MLKISELIETKVQTVTPNTPLIEAVHVLNSSDYPIIPVVDKKNILQGTLSERDLILKDSYIHLSTLYKLLGQFDYYKRDKGLIEGDLKQIIDLKVKDVMSTKVDAIQDDNFIEQALNEFSKTSKDALPVVDKDNKVVGILTITDLTKYYGVSIKNTNGMKAIDKSVDKFLNTFEKNFVVVSRTHTKLWLLFSILFTFLGFFIATILIIRFSIKT